MAEDGDSDEEVPDENGDTDFIKVVPPAPQMSLQSAARLYCVSKANAQVSPRP